MKKYDVIYADPPWKYGSRGARSGRFDKLDYNDMTIGDLIAMDVNSLAAPNCALHMWATGSFIADAIVLGSHWGFKFIRVDKVWNKKTQTGKSHAVCGPWGMSDCEFILLFTKGQMCSKQKGKRNQYTSVDEVYPGVHSEKPSIFRKQIENRYVDGFSRLEMFARCAPEGWDVFGNQAPNSIQIGERKCSTHQF